MLKVGKKMSVTLSVGLQSRNAMKLGKLRNNHPLSPLIRDNRPKLAARKMTARKTRMRTAMRWLTWSTWWCRERGCARVRQAAESRWYLRVMGWVTGKHFVSSTMQAHQVRRKRRSNLTHTLSLPLIPMLRKMKSLDLQLKTASRLRWAPRSCHLMGNSLGMTMMKIWTSKKRRNSPLKPSS